jgi:hypothetical protein
MKKSSVETGFALLFGIIFFSLCLTSCKKTENPIKFPKGTFPDTTTVALTDINSEFDDYNLDLHQLYSSVILLYSSNRNSSGGQFDLVQGVVSYVWDQTTGVFGYGSEVTSDAFLARLATAANTSGNDFGPYRLFSAVDGYEYLLLASENASGNLDFYYLKNLPGLTSQLPAVSGPFPVTLLNTGNDDAYICFDTNQDTAYFSSNVGGNFDIYIKQRPAETPLSDWFEGTYSASSAVDNINSSSDDICPFAFKKIMVFTSNRPGGMGGFDLYYSIFKDGKWNTPENFGPDVNTASDEYRPVIGSDRDFTNYMLMFSSNRPGGKGGFDLYFRGVTISTE